MNNENIKKVILAGKYASDLAVRFEFTNIDNNKIHIEKDIEASIEYLKKEAIGHIYVITCFSDQDKVLSRVEVQS